MEEAGLRRVGEAGVLGMEADALEAQEMEVTPARHCSPPRSHINRTLVS
jgi:hypothetical protein